MGRPSIYGLYDAAGELRYIGKANDPAKRLKSHLAEKRRKTPLYDWIRKHGAPEMRVLEADCENWQEAERRLIAEALERGDRLLNVAAGGDEPHCDIETRRANGRKVAKAIHSDPLERFIWNAKRALGRAIKDGTMKNSTRAKLRRAAMLNPERFGIWANLPDRIE